MYEGQVALGGRPGIVGFGAALLAVPFAGSSGVACLFFWPGSVGVCAVPGSYIHLTLPTSDSVSVSVVAVSFKNRYHFILLRQHSSSSVCRST